MVEETANLVLEHLRAIRTDVSQIKTVQAFMAERIASLEKQMVGVHTAVTCLHRMVGVHTPVTGLHSDVANTNAQLDDIRNRLERIERRLELASV